MTTKHFALIALASGGCFYHHDYGDDYQPYPYVDAGPRPDAPDAPDAPPDAPDAPPPCVPMTCSDVGATCGSVADGCGTDLACGTCTGPATCGGEAEPTVCAIPPADRQCINGWCWEAPSPYASTMRDIFARTPTDVWMIGEAGMIQHFDGTTWKPFASGTTNELTAIWMASATDGWIVGKAGTLRRWNGTAWTTIASGTTTDLTGVHGSGASNVWIVGDAVSRKWNGTLWTAGAATTPYLEKVYVTPNNHVFATSGAIVVENTLGTWNAVTSDTTGSLNYPYFEHIVGSGTTAYAVGGVGVTFGTDYDWVWKWNGSMWARIDEPGVGIYHDAFVDGTKAMASTEVHVWDMATNVMTQGPGFTLDQVSGAAGEMFTANTDGLPYHFAASAWTPATRYGDVAYVGKAFLVGDDVWFARGDSLYEWNGGLVEHDIGAYWQPAWISGPDRSNIWAVDYDSAFQRSQYAYHFDGSHWKRVVIPSRAFHAIHASATETVMFGDLVQRRDGTTWIEETPPEAASWTAISAVGDDVYAIGSDATPAPHLAVRHAGGAWAAMTAPPVTSLCGIAATAADDIWVTGSDTPAMGAAAGIVAHWNGTAWSVERPVGTDSFCGITVRAGDVWAIAGSKGIYHRAAAGGWSAVPSVMKGGVRGLIFDHATPANLWATADYGAVFRRTIP